MPGAQAQAPATAGIIRGHITDPSGALIPGASITVTNSSGTQPVTATADASGAYEDFRGLAPGGYIVSAMFDGFAPFQSVTIQVAAGQAKRVDIAMAIEVAQQNVVVTDDSPTVSTEAGANANALVLKGADLDALSDDPDELSSELSALAGPSAGPNGGQIFIDGFTGGQLPPKSAIREIRINQNPFSAEFDRLGYGRIEILTKPGTDKFHAQGFVQGNDNIFNTGNPFAASIPSYHSIQFNGTMNGALSKKASFFLSAEQRNNQGDHIYNAETAALESSSASTLYRRPGYRWRLQPPDPHQHCPAHRLPARQQKYFHRALPVLPQLRERTAWLQSLHSAHASHILHIHRANASIQRLHHPHRARRQRNPLPVPARH